MLAAIIANLQNVVPGPSPRPPMVHVDRGGGGPLGPRVDIVDIISALGTFQETPGEHPVARAVRRSRHVQDHLGSVVEHRERREASAFLAGAALGRAAAIEDMISIVDEVRKAACTERVCAAAPPCAPEIVDTRMLRGISGREAPGVGGENMLGVVIFAAAAIGVVALVKRLSA